MSQPKAKKQFDFITAMLLHEMPLHRSEHHGGGANHGCISMVRRGGRTTLPEYLPVQLYRIVGGVSKGPTR